MTSNPSMESPLFRSRWGDLHKRHIRRRRRVEKSSDPAIDIDLMCSWLFDLMHVVCTLTIWHNHTQSWQKCRRCSPGGVDLDFSQNDSNRIWSFPHWDWLVFMVLQIHHFQTAIQSASREHSKVYISETASAWARVRKAVALNGRGDLCDILVARSEPQVDTMALCRHKKSSDVWWCLTGS